MNIKDLIGCVTQKGRRKLVKRILEKELSCERIVDIASAGTSALVNGGLAKMTESQVGTLHTNLTELHAVTGTLLRVTDLGSDGGREITEPEREQLRVQVLNFATGVLTDARVAAVHDLILAKVP